MLIYDRKVIWVVGNDGNEGKFRLDYGHVLPLFTISLFLLV